MNGPAVTVVVPTLDEEEHIGATLDAIAAQTYPDVVEVLVVDGGSGDRTRAIARDLGATVLANPARIQAVALNLAIEAARGDVLVRVDGHCRVAPDYVERCVDALERTGAAMVGGAMTPVGTDGWQRAIALALTSPVGAGPARFHVGGAAGWVDTVYLGAFRVADARAIGGYRPVAQNEDAEFAIRIADLGGVWFDPAIRSEYTPRATLPRLVLQFWRYGRSRAATVRRHPRSLAPRQLAAPILLVGLISPWRRTVLGAYGAVLVGEAVRQTVRAGADGARVGAVLPAMHLPWAAGFLTGLVARR